MAEQDTPPPTITTMKIPIIKKGEYDIWSMRMRQYISIPDEYILKFHNVPNAKSLRATIKSRFGGNEESKKMQKNVLKHQFENFTTAPNESLDKAYDRFQKLISQLEVHAAPVSKEDINQKFLRSLPPSWSQIALIMRNKPDIDQTDIDDLYNNLRVYEDEMKRSSSSTSNSQNLAFLSSENTSSTNEVSTASGNFGVNTAGGTSSTSQGSSTPGADEVSPTHYPCDSARTFRVILFSIHNDEWKSFQCHHQTALRSYALSWKPCQGDSLNLPDHRIHKDGDGDASFQLKSDSLPHAHAHSTKTFYKHQDSRIMKAQELKTKTSANSDINDNSSEIKLRGRLLESFQDDAKYEHVGQDTRSQGGKDVKDKQG
ncbi:hypothetical protein Tco_1407219 [Tanacetum coccineum]